MTRIGLIGCGTWGKLILRDLLSLGAEVMVVAPTPGTRNVALQKGAVSVHADVGSLPPADGYVIATPTGTHAAMIEALLSTGRPIFCEKPLTNDPLAAQSIADRAGDRVFSMDKWRYHCGILKLAELAQSGRLGRILQVQSLRLEWQNRSWDVDSIWWLMPHDLSIALEILGHLPEPRWASGFMAYGTQAEVTAVLQDGDGPMVTMTVSGCQPVNRRSVVVAGTEGVAQLGGSLDDRLLIRWRDGRAEEVEIASDMPLLTELQVFLDHVRGGPPPKSPAPEAALIIRRIAAIRAMAGLGIK